jgi:hypothetical protein
VGGGVVDHFVAQFSENSRLARMIVGTVSDVLTTLFGEQIASVATGTNVIEYEKKDTALDGGAANGVESSVIYRQNVLENLADIFDEVAYKVLTASTADRAILAPKIRYLK